MHRFGEASFIHPRRANLSIVRSEISIGTDANQLHHRGNRTPMRTEVARLRLRNTAPLSPANDGRGKAPNRARLIFKKPLSSLVILDFLDKSSSYPAAAQRTPVLRLWPRRCSAHASRRGYCPSV